MIVTEFELTQPLVFVSVTVYVVFTVGLTEFDDAVDEYPDGVLDQEYVLPVTAVAPIAVVLPGQILEFVPALAAGREFTVTVTLFEATQPLTLVSVTV